MDSPSSELSTRSQSVTGGIEQPGQLVLSVGGGGAHGYSNSDTFSMHHHNSSGKSTHPKQLVVTAGKICK